VAYHPLANDSGGTPESRREEATRILRMLDSVDLDTMTASEKKFCNGMYADEDQAISPKQLFWLRDLREKYS
jgi:hypothetical protein